MGVVGILSETSSSLTSINPPFPPWVARAVLRLRADAPPKTIIAGVLALERDLDCMYMEGHHGPFRAGVLTPHDYVQSTRQRVVDRFGAWMTSYTPDDPVDASPLLDEVIRPHLRRGELYLLARDPNVEQEALGAVDLEEHPVFSPWSFILEGWCEVIVIDRAEATVTMLTASGD